MLSLASSSKKCGRFVTFISLASLKAEQDYSSFSRQLNIYGFKRIQQTKEQRTQGIQVRAHVHSLSEHN